MHEISYEPIENLSEAVTRADLDEFYEKLRSLYEYGRQPETVIQIGEES